MRKLLVIGLDGYELTLADVMMRMRAAAFARGDSESRVRDFCWIMARQDRRGLRGNM